MADTSKPVTERGRVIEIVEKKAEDTGSYWQKIGYVFLWGTPIVFAGVIGSMMYFGSAWWLSFNNTTAYVVSLGAVAKSAPELQFLRAGMSFALLAVIFSFLRVTGATMIPPEATLRHGVDRMIALIPAGTIAAFILRSFFLGLPYDALQAWCIMIALTSSLLIDVWACNMIQNQIKLSRRSVDIR